MNKVGEYLKKHHIYFIFLVASILLFLVDLISEWIVEVNCDLYKMYPIIPNFLYVTKSYNIAIAFSLGSQLGVFGRILNITISLVMSVIIMVYWFKKKEQFRKRDHAVAMLLFAGAFGNLIDRAFYWEGITGFNGVIDFIQFYLGGGPTAPSNFVNPFATFNFADSFLVIGIIILIILMFVDNFKATKGTKDDLSIDPRLNPETEEEEPHEEETH